MKGPAWSKFGTSQLKIVSNAYDGCRQLDLPRGPDGAICTDLKLTIGKVLVHVVLFMSLSQEAP